MRLDAPAGERTGRFAIIDAARGAALLAMIVYHFTWDLGFYGLTTIDAASDPGWRAFARIIAGSFLALVGVSLVLATRNGLRLRPFLRRLALVAGAAAAITIATHFAMPQTYIFFGILHNIALSSVLGLAFLRVPLWVVVATAGIVLAAPHFVSLPLFDSALLLWVGLGTTAPATNDYVPVFPWFGTVLLGIAAARLALSHGVDASPLAHWRASDPASRLLTLGGRHSLLVYLLHQPILLGLLFVVAGMVGPRPAIEAARFVTSCEATCRENGADAEFCRASCMCLAEQIDDLGLWAKAADGTLEPAQSRRIAEAAQQCRAASEGAGAGAD